MIATAAPVPCAVRAQSGLHAAASRTPAAHSPAVRIPAALLLTGILLAATGCTPFRAGLPSEPLPPAAGMGEPATAVGAAIARSAAAQMGTPYRYGGSDPARGFDCSGLVSYTYAQEGIGVPRTAAAQFAAARRIAPDQLRAGDLVFFRLVPASSEVTHVGIYTGGRRFVHAPQTGRSVSEASLDDPYYRERFAGAGRFDAAGAGAAVRQVAPQQSR